eukprot:4023576-Pleurochrysis_carterae.AAC.6
MCAVRTRAQSCARRRARCMFCAEVSAPSNEEQVLLEVVLRRRDAHLADRVREMGGEPVERERLRVARRRQHVEHLGRAHAVVQLADRLHSEAEMRRCGWAAQVECGQGEEGRREKRTVECCRREWLQSGQTKLDWRERSETEEGGNGREQEGEAESGRGRGRARASTRERVRASKRARRGERERERMRQVTAGERGRVRMNEQASRRRQGVGGERARDTAVNSYPQGYPSIRIVKLHINGLNQ